MHNSYSHNSSHFTIIYFLIKPTKMHFPSKILYPCSDFAEISQCCGVIHDRKTVLPDFAYLFPFGCRWNFLENFTIKCRVLSEKWLYKPNGKRYPKSGKTVFESCITPQDCGISAKSEQGLRIFEGKTRFGGFYQKMNSGEIGSTMHFNTTWQQSDAILSTLFPKRPS